MGKMSTYVKKPVPVRARQIKRAMKVETLEGTFHGRKGDYLVVGVRGEKYIVRRDIFEETYELVQTPRHVEKPPRKPQVQEQPSVVRTPPRRPTHGPNKSEQELYEDARTCIRILEASMGRPTNPDITAKDLDSMLADYVDENEDSVQLVRSVRGGAARFGAPA